MSNGSNQSMSGAVVFPHRKYSRYPLVRRRRRWPEWRISGDALCWLAGLGWIVALLALEWMR